MTVNRQFHFHCNLIVIEVSNYHQYKIPSLSFVQRGIGLAQLRLQVTDMLQLYIFINGTASHFCSGQLSTW